MAIRSSETAFYTRGARSAKRVGCWDAASIQSPKGITPTQLHKLIKQIARKIPQNYKNTLLEINSSIGAITRNKSPELTKLKTYADTLLEEIVNMVAGDATIDPDNIIPRLPKQTIMWDILLEILDGGVPHITQRSIGLAISKIRKRDDDTIDILHHEAIDFWISKRKIPIENLATSIQRLAYKKQQEVAGILH